MTALAVAHSFWTCYHQLSTCQRYKFACQLNILYTCLSCCKACLSMLWPRRGGTPGTGRQSVAKLKRKDKHSHTYKSFTVT